MKRFLTTLAALGITASSATAVISCGSTTKNPVETDPLTDTTVIDDITTSLGEQTTANATFDVPSNTQTQDQIKNLVVNQNSNLTKYGKWLSINVISFTPASTAGDQGTIVLELLHDNKALINPQDGSSEFVFNFMTKDILDDMGQTIPEITDKVVDFLNNNPTLDLSDFQVDIDKDIPGVGGHQTIASLIQTVLPLIQQFVPAKVPANFTSDENWTNFQGLINLASTMLKDKNTIDVSVTPTEGMSLSIKLKITDILISILPDLIHANNFIKQQSATGNSNLVLGVIQYLFAKPVDINDDGFGEINQGIVDINHEGETITFATNLERLVYDLFEGWQTSDGTKAPITPVQINFNDQAIRYQSDTTDEDNITIGIFDSIPEVNLTNFIDFILGTSHTWDEDQNEQIVWTGGYDLSNPSSFILSLGGLLLGLPTSLPLPIPTTGLADAIKGALKTFLNSDANLATKLDYLTFDWTQGEMTIEYQKQDGTWVQAQTTADLLLANAPKDIRVKFVGNTWKVGNKLDDQVTTIQDKDLILNLDLNTPATNSGSN